MAILQEIWRVNEQTAIVFPIQLGCFAEKVKQCFADNLGA